MNLTFLWLKLPLKKPYRLPFTTIEHFDTMLCFIHGNGEIAWGESTALPGYSWETPSSMWESVSALLSSPKASLADIKLKAEHSLEKSPFALTPILTAIEKTSPHKEGLFPPLPARIPLAGIVQGDSVEDLLRNFKDRVEEGFRTVKMKLSPDVHNDLLRIGAVQSILPESISIRLDANQVYSKKAAEIFNSEVDPKGLEFLEQPFKPEDWDLHESLSRKSRLPIMLDESIWTATHIQKAKDIGINAVKLKLSKHGSLSRTLSMIGMAQQLGMDVVLGNGVQSHFGCIDECSIFEKTGISKAGEMNGFDKISIDLPEIISIRDGNAEISRTLERAHIDGVMKKLDKHIYRRIDTATGERR